MILSLFIVSNGRVICMEKHWRNVISKSVCDFFFDSEGSKDGDDTSPVIRTAHHYLINIYRDSLYYLAVCNFEVPPLFVIEFLHKFVDILNNYFGVATETIIKDNIVRIYEILDEMLDNGFPLVTESNVLEELVRPPSLLRTFTDTVVSSNRGNSSLGQSLPKGQLGSVPWRRVGVKYSRNEAFFDVVEYINVVIDRAGSISRCEIDGYIDSNIRMSGTPDLTLAFSHPALLDDVSLHPCIRYLRWQRDRIISFIPPDGKFRLMTYHTIPPSNMAMPFTIRGSVTNNRLEIILSPKRVVSKPIKDMLVTIRMPIGISNVNATGSIGRCQYESSRHLFVWNIGGLEPQQAATMRGTCAIDTTTLSSSNNDIDAATLLNGTLLLELDFTIQQFSASGIRVSRLDLQGETYKPFKGVKYITKAGNYQVST